MPLVAPAAAGCVVIAAISVVRAGDSRRLARVDNQLPQVAHALAAGLGAGLSLRQALSRVARDAPDPVAAELRAAVDEMALGARVETALGGLAERLPSRDVRVMVTAILVQRRTGGNLARALAVLADRLDERARLGRELRGATVQARLTAWMVAALPVGAAAMAEVASPGTLRRVLGEPPGSVLAIVSVALYAAGVVWVRRIGRVEA
jgi:tight adherence protein B